MARSWQEIQALPEFQALDARRQEGLRNKYFRHVVAPQVPTEELDAARANFDAETAPPVRNESFAGDIPDLVQKGLYNAAGGVLDFVGADTPAEWLYDQAKAQEQTLTPETVQALEQPLFSEEGDYYLGEGFTSPRAWLAQGLETLGGMALPIPGGALARAALRPWLGMGKAAQAAKGVLMAEGVAERQAGRLAQRLAPDWRDTAATVAGYGGMEGLVSAGLSEQQTREQVLAMPQAQLEQAPAYWEAMQQAGGDPQAARQLLAENLGKEAGWKTFGPTVALGAGAGRYYDRLIGGGGTGSRLKNMLQGGATEMLEEAPQSAAETLAQNTTLQQVDPTIGTTDNLIPNMLTGAALGGATGGVIAGLMPKGTLARAADAGGQAQAAGLPAQPQPSAGEVIRQQQEQARQQQELARQQQEEQRRLAEEQRKAVEQQQRDALAAQKAAQEAEKTRQAQIKTQKAQLDLANVGGVLPVAPGVTGSPGPDTVPADVEWGDLPADIVETTDPQGRPLIAETWRSRDGQYEWRRLIDPDTGEVAQEDKVAVTPPAAPGAATPGAAGTPTPTPAAPDSARSVVAATGISPAPGTGSVTLTAPAGTGMPPTPETGTVTPPEPKVAERVRTSAAQTGKFFTSPGAPPAEQITWGEEPETRTPVPRRDGVSIITTWPSQDGRWQYYEDRDQYTDEVYEAGILPREGAPGEVETTPEGVPAETAPVAPPVEAPPVLAPTTPATPTPISTPTTTENANGQKAMQGTGQAPDAPPAAVGGQASPAVVKDRLTTAAATAGNEVVNQELTTEVAAPGTEGPAADAGGPPADLVEVVDGFGTPYRVRQRDLDQPERTLLPTYDKQGKPLDAKRRLNRANIVADPQTVPRYRTRQALKQGGYQTRERVRSNEQEQALYGNGFRPVLLAEDGVWELSPWEGIWAKPPKKQGAWGELRPAQKGPEMPGQAGSPSEIPNNSTTKAAPVAQETEADLWATLDADRQHGIVQARKKLPQGFEIRIERIRPTERVTLALFRTGEDKSLVNGISIYNQDELVRLANQETLKAASSPEKPDTLPAALVAEEIKTTKQKLLRARREGKADREESLQRQLRAQRQRVYEAEEELATNGYVETTAEFFPGLPQKQQSAATVANSPEIPDSSPATGPGAATLEAEAPRAPTAATPPTEPTAAPAAALPERPADWGANNTLVSRERAEELRKRLKAKLGQLNAGLDPEVLAIGTELAVFHIEAGVRRFADLARQLASDLDEPLERLRPYLRSWYNGARDMMEDSGLDVAGMDDPAQVREGLQQLFAPNETGPSATGDKTPTETTNDNRGVRGGDQAPLEKVAAAEVEGAGGQRADGGRDNGGGADGQPGEDAADAGRVPGARGRRGGAPRVYPAETGAQAEDAAGQAGGQADELGGSPTSPEGRPGGRRAGGGTRTGTRTGTGTRGGRRRPSLEEDTPQPTDALREGDLGTARINGVPVAPPAIPARNFTITDEIALGEGGQVRKYNDNVAAIRIVQALAAEKRRATPEEQAVLARYVGWGGIHQAFPNPETKEWAKGWQARGEALRELLGGENGRDYRTARRSTQYAHFTSQAVVAGMWNLAERLGFRGGLMLESAAGVGNFLGLMPAGLRGDTRAVAVEMDGMSARILAALYPQAAAIHSPTNKLPIASNSFDLAIGNPPYSKTGVRWQYKPEINRFSLHNQFVLADLDNLRENGLYVGVVTHFLLDAQDPAARLEMAAEAEFLGAIRLPNTAFEENALTEVVTDILVFRKRTRAEWARFETGKRTAETERTKPNTQFTPEELEALAYYQEEISWTGTTEVPDPLGGEPLTVGAWLAANPEMMLGTLERSGTMRAQGELTLKARPGVKIVDALAAAIRRFPVNRVQPTDDAIAVSKARFENMAAALEIAARGDEPGAMRINADGALTQVLEREIPGGGVEMMQRTITADSPWSPRLLVDEEGRWFELVEKLDEQGNKVKQAVGRAMRNVYERKTYASEAEVPASLRLGTTRYERLRSLVQLRDLLKQQIVLETQGAPENTLETNRTQLREAYEAYRAKHGLINEGKSAALVSEMPDGALVLALELGYKDGISAERARRVGERPRPPSARPAEILFRRVIVPYEPAQRAESVADALAVSLAETGRVDLKRIAALLGVMEAQAQQQLTEGDEPLVFFDPESQRLETRDAYLSGQVRRKLEAARAAGLTANVAALEKVQPALWTAEQVTAKIGANWIPPDVWEAFFAHLTGGEARVTYHRIANAFEVSFNGGEQRLNWDEWGVPNPAGGPKASAADLLTAMLNSRPMRLGYTDDEGKFHLDEAQTELAKLKMNQIAMEFADWVFADGERRQRLTALFNEKFNTRVNRQHDGSHLQFPGKVPDQIIRMRRSQKNAVWRGIVEKVLLLDHVVGAGKTFTGIARAMERKRLGLAKKPMIVVPNHLVESWAADVYRLYPGAKVLAAGKQDFERSRRRRLFAKIATGDWDIVIMPHSSFGKLGISPETEERYLQQALEEAIQARDEAQAAADQEPQGGRPRKPLGVKAAEALMQKIENRLDALRSKSRDNLLTFEELGVDDLTIDEAHEFKNLFYTSNLQGVRGMGDRAGSQKALDLYNKVRTLHENPNGAIAFMTGTPISNSAVELYTLMRYLAPAELQELGLEHFDAWRAQYVDSQTSWEMNDTARLQEVTRLGPNWSNMRSLMELYYSFSDAVTLDDLRQAYAEDNDGARFPVPDVKGGGRQTIKADPTPAQAEILAEVVAGFNALPNEPDPDERNAQRLRLMDRARKVSLDARAVDGRLNTTEPGGKLEKATTEILRLYRQWDADRGTQLVFLDRSVPKSRQDAAVLRDYDRAVAAREAAIRANDEEALLAAEDALGRFDPLEMAALREAQSGGWNAYQQLKDNLVAQGIPANEIRFVQEANTDEQKKALFDAVNLGEVRVLIGSTARMGAGTNVQERLVGLHHLDVNWRPADIEQREGRIIRQGNSLLEKYGFDDFQIEILAYVTERTVDAKMWELNAKKLKNVNGIRKYNGEFEMEFSDEEAVSMAETAALASGDPLLLERVRLMAEIQKLELLERAHRRKSFAIEDRVSELERIIATYPKRIEAMKAEEGRARAELEQVREAATQRTVTVEGKPFTWEQKLAAFAAVDEAVAIQKDGKEHGRYSINIDGQNYTTKEGYTEAIDRALGDAGLFAVDLQGQTHGSRLMAARALAELINTRLGAMEPGGKESFRVGKMLGATLTVDLVQAGVPNFTGGGLSRGEVTLTLEREGVTLDHSYNSLSAGSPLAVQPVRESLNGLWQRMNYRALDGAKYMEQTLEGAKVELPEAQAKRGQPFAQAEELTGKRQRLVEVVRALSDDPQAAMAETDAGQAMTPELAAAETVTEGGPRYAMGQARGPRIAKPEAERLLARALGGKVAEVLLDSGIITLTNAGNRYQGVTWRDGTLFLNLDALTAGNFEGVLLHEGFHSAVRELLGETKYQELMAQLNKLLASPAGWVKEAKAAVPADTAAANLTEEVGAYAISQALAEAPLPNLLRRWAEGFMSALRAAIIRRLPAGRLKNWALANLKPMDLARLARAGLRAKARGMRVTQGRVAPAFSIAASGPSGKPKPSDVVLVDGKEEFGEVSSKVAAEAKAQTRTEITPAPIKLLYGQHEGPHNGFGLAHIEAERGDQIRRLGMTPENFVLSVLKEANQIWQSGRRLVIAKTGRTPKAMVIELQAEDGYYSVVTAYPVNSTHKMFGKLAWKGRALDRYTGMRADGLESQRAPFIDQQLNNPPEPLSGNNTLHPPLDTLRGRPGDENIDPKDVAGNPDIRFSLAPDSDAGGSPLGGGKALLDSVKQAMADQWTGKLGTSLGALTLRQLADVGSAWLPGIKLYDRLRTRMETRRNVMMEESGRLGDAVDSWARHRAHRDEARRVFELMNDATLQQVDPADYQPLKIPLQLGPGFDMVRNWEATEANVQELRRRVRAWKKSSNVRERELAGYYQVAARKLALAVKAEAKRRAAYPELLQRWEALSSGKQHLGADGKPFASEQEARAALVARRWPKGTALIVEEVEGGWAIQELGGKEVYTRFRDLYQKRSEEMLEALIKRLDSLESLDDVDKRALAARIRAEFEAPIDEQGNPRIGPYFPLQRFGRFYVFARRFGAEGPRTFTRKDGEPFESAESARAALYKREDLKGVNARAVELEDGSGWVLEDQGEPGFWLFESVGDRRRAVAELEAEGWQVVRQGLTAEAHRELQGVSETFVADAVDKLKKQGSKDEADALYQMYLQTLQQMSIRKKFIHRKGTKGYTDDQLRAYGWNMTRLAHQISKLEGMPGMEKILRGLEQGLKEAVKEAPGMDTTRQDALLEEVKKRHEWIANPDNAPWTNAVAALGFLFYLGVSPAAALVNLSQVPIVALPVLAARLRGWARAGGTTVTADGRSRATAESYGPGGAWGEAGRALTTAFADVARGFKPGVLKGFITGRPLPSEAANLTAEERAAFAEWDKSGARDRTQAHNLAGIGDADSWLNGPTFNRVMGAISSLFHLAEVANRDATLLAAYRLARSRGISHEVATLQAEEATWEAHFDYSNANRARFMQPNVAKALLMFKNYAQHVLYFLGRNLYLWARGESKEVRQEARTKFAGMVGMTALFAGASGLPIGGAFVVANLVQALFGDDDEPWDAEVEWRNMLREVFPRDVADIIDRGAVNKLTGMDFASRVSIADLIYRAPDRDLDGAGMFQHVVEQLMGPVGGIAARPFSAYDDLREGHWGRAAEALAPKFLKDLGQMGRFGYEGVLSRKGDAIMAPGELSSYELFGKGLGFTPDDLAVRYDSNRAIKLYEGRIDARRRELILAAALAIIERDPEGLRAARQKIAAYNRAVPKYPISEATIRRSVRARQQMRERAEDGIIVNPKLAYLRDEAGGFGRREEEMAEE